jgi:hypothetical protein
MIKDKKDIRFVFLQKKKMRRLFIYIQKAQKEW